ncbi:MULTISPECIES: M18 family aminopeptidase [unclassified Rhodococcus (in: high G+C Gram-positive bacteria)]|uniref:M18 family aminopeptidase n=1 Tax=unclassified Rhodococcus (in: high G+C Gram-positive bacteria) TaxID=192944 RepID=UPI000701A77D|nr:MULTISPECIES: M18 family aminopeptidase [unclassified Rhodococcus (in: high G+C Gram-positive bacteria)]KQU39626.1 aminopeptidase [Rhodococcus sp. Leaf225]KQU44063.1 aminopeptidase [Rhodococcus sp. Leaf258]MBY6679077.1 M18 family aminopeptidase [Rhodococcus sp. BP-332]MDQ1202904.1 aspartyl aminopeptidase [Rhodococcus sp. SORGH_AS_0303]
MASLTSATAAGLCSFVDASPSPFHVVETVASELAAHGFTAVAETDAWPSEPGRYLVVRGGSIIAWSTERAPDAAFRIVGGHTDSPNLRVKQNPDLDVAGWQMVALEPYGGAWLNSWLDRDLGISGRLGVRDGGSVRDVLVRVDRPILRVPQLAIHLSEDRKGVHLDPQNNVNAIWGVGRSPHSFIGFLADEVGVDPGDVLGWELMTHDLNPAAVVGLSDDLVSSPRLDNQGTCYAGTEALVVAAAQADDCIPVLALFDHEEVGSMSDRGAFSDLMNTVLERIVLARGGGREEFLRAMAGSIHASGDMAHATHPNYVSRHEPAHRIEVNGGPVLKVNQNLRYATDAAGAAAFALACERADVPLQRYVHRADLPCGSTIGPITASRTGLSTVDVGAAQLAMHSAREVMGAHDVDMYADALAAFLGA